MLTYLFEAKKTFKRKHSSPTENLKADVSHTTGTSLNVANGCDNIWRVAESGTCICTVEWETGVIFVNCNIAPDNNINNISNMAKVRAI